MGLVSNINDLLILANRQNCGDKTKAKDRRGAQEIPTGRSGSWERNLQGHACVSPADAWSHIAGKHSFSPLPAVPAQRPFWIAASREEPHAHILRLSRHPRGLSGYGTIHR